MKGMLIALMGALTVGTSFAQPQITQVALTQDPLTQKILITYSLNEAAVVTLDDVLMNDVSVGRSNLVSVVGDVSVRVEPGDHKICWLAWKDVPSAELLSGKLKVRLSAWPLNAPPPCMVVPLNLAEGEPTNILFYASITNLPGGHLNLDYATSHLVMCRIPAKDVIWRMGDDWSRLSKDQYTNAAPHYVMLTNDYYMGMFQITQGQYELVCGERPSNQSTNWVASPVDCVSYEKLRGSAKTKTWPEDGHSVAADSVIDKFRKSTGLMVDLPTDAQWEFACRAGTATKYNNGTDNDPNACAWTGYNKAAPGYGYVHPSGLLQPNAYDLYDMHGQCWEWCLDLYLANYWNSDADNWIYSDYSGSPQTVRGVPNVSVDPVGIGKTSGATRRCCRGAGCNNGSSNAISSFRNSSAPNSATVFYTGFRLVCPVPEL